MELEEGFLNEFHIGLLFCFSLFSEVAIVSMVDVGAGKRKWSLKVELMKIEDFVCADGRRGAQG